MRGVDSNDDLLDYLTIIKSILIDRAKDHDVLKLKSSESNGINLLIFNYK